MKYAVILCAVLALGFSAPRQNKLFHEHFEEFIDIIEEEAVDDMISLFEQYLEFDEFMVSLDYVWTTDFKNLVYEMESLPEFKAVVEFLENDNIDILYFIDRFNDALEEALPRKRQGISGKDLTSYIYDTIDLFPKAKLQALFDKKMAEEEDFKNAIENLKSEKWDRIWNALWDSETFQEEARILADNGIELRVLLDELMAIFGQN